MALSPIGPTHLPPYEELATRRINAAAAIASIDSEKITLIAEKIAAQIVNNLGPIKKTEIESIVRRKKGEPLDAIDMMLQMTQHHTRGLSAERSSPFLNQDEISTLTIILKNVLKAQIATSFSLPDRFLEVGAAFFLADYHATRLLAEAATQVNIDLNINTVPFKYWVDLRLDKRKTEEEGEVIFTISHTSDRFEFSKNTFLLSALEQERVLPSVPVSAAAAGAELQQE